MKGLWMKLARSRFGGMLVHIGITYLGFLLPVRPIHRSETAVMLPHPAPMRPGHAVIVPRFRVRDLKELISHPDRLEAMLGYLCEHVDLTKKDIVVNLGSRQEVGQLHFHALERTAEPERIRVGAGDGWALYEPALCVIDARRLGSAAVLREAVDAGCAAFPGGMSVVWK